MNIVKSARTISKGKKRKLPVKERGRAHRIEMTHGVSYGEKTHSKKRACRSARSGDKQKRPFPYPPPSMHRFPFVKTVQEKGGGIYGKKSSKNNSPADITLPS